MPGRGRELVDGANQPGAMQGSDPEGEVKTACGGLSFTGGRPLPGIKVNQSNLINQGGTAGK
ncbi:MAG TPA: hypothetical protein GX504_03070 [Clostridia bacterium]|nr:hypothetical protein [Clostridia bacterium]